MIHQKKKADLIGGKVPAEQLPSYVDDVIDIAAFVTKTELVNNIGKANYTNKNFIVNSPTSDPLYNKIVITNANTSQNDWEIIDPEDGKIYINYEILYDSLLISIKNEGRPIDYSVIKRLNEENLSDVQRHGMGLFVSKQICSLHKGVMKIENYDQAVCVSFIFDLK